MLEWRSHALDIRSLDAIERKFVGRDSLGLLIDGSFGDVLITLCFLEEFHKLHQRSVVVFLPAQYALFSQIYTEDGLSFVSVENSSLIRRNLATRGHHILEPGYIYPTLPTMHPLIAEAMSSERMTDLDIRTLILGLPKESQYRFPVLPQSLLRQIDESLHSLEVDLHNAILFSPVTNTLKSFSIDYVEEILSILSESGTVITNVSGANESLKEIALKYGAIYEIPPYGIRHISEKFGRHVIIASGLMYVLSLFKTQCRFLHLIPAAKKDFVVNNGMMTRSELYSVYFGGKNAADNDIYELWIAPGNALEKRSIIRDWIG